MTQTVPPTLQQQIEALSHTIRHSYLHELTSSNLQHYHDFVRAHVMDVIKQTFPHFYRYINEADKLRYVDDFIRRHAAVEPEFYQIATEFVRFIQQYPISDPQILSIIEYEWVLLSVSILPDVIDSANTTIVLHQTNKHPYFIQLNPTLYCIEVPFFITEETFQFVEEERFFYGIFRNAEHQVLYKSLNMQERYLIELLREAPLITYDDLIKQAPFSSTDALNDWLMQNYMTRLININNKENA